MAVSVASLNPTNTTNLSSTAAGGLNSSSTGTSNRGTNNWHLALNFGGDLNDSLTGPSFRSMSTATPARGGQMESPAHTSSADPGSSSHPSPSSNGISGLPYPTTGAGNPFTPQGAAGTGWTPSPNATPFYPQFTPFYPHAHTPVSGTGTPPTGVPIPQLGGTGPLPPGAQGFGYFNPGMPGMGGGMDANQQIAWAYQQMMLQQAALAHQHQNQINAAMAELGRTRANSHGSSSPAGQIPMPGAEFFPPNVNPALLPGFPFQAGTPPAHGHGYQGGTPQQQQSYRGRNVSGGSGVGPQGHLGALRSNTFDNQDWSRLTAQGLPVPYARPEAAGSSHSISSNGSGGSPAGRARTNSNNTNRSQTPPSSLRGQNHHHGSSHGSGQNTPTRGTTVPQLTTDFNHRQQHNRLNSSNPPSPVGAARPAPHQRSVSNTSSDRSMSTASGRGSSSPTISNSNQAPSISASSAAPSSTTSSPNHSPLSRTNQRAPTKPSPLSQQQTFSSSSPAIGEGATSKRAKRLSKDDSELLPQATVASALTPRQSGLKGRFKRALAFQPPSSVDEHGDSSSIGHGDSSPNGTSPYGTPDLTQSEAGHDSPITPINDKPKSRARQLFSGKFNASTDNISLSSTVSSASVMIRKLGSITQLARRNTLTNIKGIFKGDKKDKGDGTSVKKGKDKKGVLSEPSVSHATVELDRGLDRGDDDSLVGLTPAARVARQHTLKSNAEAARRLREQAATTTAAHQSQQAAGVPSWDKSTTNRRGEASNASRGVSEDGTLNESDDGSGEGGYDPSFDPDATVRMNGTVDLVEESDEDEELWAIGIRRSLERTRRPGKPVIKNHVGYIQEQHLDPPNTPFAARIRSNSYQTVAESQPGPLAHLPPPDPGQIDGLQRSSSTHNTPEKTPFSLPAFNFELGIDGMDILPPKETESPQQEILSSNISSGTAGALANAADKGPTFAYTHTTANSSAPALSTVFPNDKTGGGPAPQPPNSLTMKKSISFAATLSIYDTFSGSVYDRRSEPSTANRLTPALAQRIKEELNSYKMEEMEVHSASKIHTHFFV